MIHRLRGLGIQDPVLRAMALVPRHAFVPPGLAAAAYGNRPICAGKTNLTDPYTVALMCQQLGLDQACRVLEVGTGSGYHTTVLALLSRQVFTIERVPELVESSAEAFESLGVRNVCQRVGDGYVGWPEASPFDAILVAAAATELPGTLVQQLDPRHGRMIIPVGPHGGCQALMIVRRNGQHIQTNALGQTQFVPFLPGVQTGRVWSARTAGSRALR